MIYEMTIFGYMKESEEVAKYGDGDGNGNGNNNKIKTKFLR